LRRITSTIVLLAAVIAIAVFAVTAAASKHSPSTSGTVVGVPAGDTLLVRIPAKGKKKAKTVRVQILGVSAPSGTSCYAAQSIAKTKSLAYGKKVTLAGYLTQRVYVSAPGTSDLGGALVSSGAAQVDVFREPFSRLAAYVPLQHTAETAGAGMWSACAADIGVTASGPKTAQVGDYLTYTGSVTNAGPLVAQTVQIELRPGTYAKQISSVSTSLGQCESKGWVAYCTINGMAPGSSATLTFGIRAVTAGALTARFTATTYGCTDAQCGSVALQDSSLDNDRAAAATIVPGGSYGLPGKECDVAYPTVCLPPPPVDLDCADFAPLRSFPVRRDAPDGDDHHLDGNGDGVACEGDDY
jgi:endonuclease YncB( thermonuclease family)